MNYFRADIQNYIPINICICARISMYGREHFRIIHVFYDSPYRCICLVLLYTYIRVDCNAGFDGMPEAVFYYGIGDTYLCCELGKGFTGGIIGEPALIDIQFSGEQPEALVDIALHVLSVYR